MLVYQRVSFSTLHQFDLPNLGKPTIPWPPAVGSLGMASTAPPSTVPCNTTWWSCWAIPTRGWCWNCRKARCPRDPQRLGCSATSWALEKMWVWVNTYRYIFSGMNIHLPAILGFTRYQGFDPSPCVFFTCFSRMNGAITCYNPWENEGLQVLH